jgi:hypothetical protein
VPSQSAFPWKAVAVVLGVLLLVLLLRGILGFVWWLAGVLVFLAVVGAIAWAVVTVMGGRRR